jgi:hypothetical protein
MASHDHDADDAEIRRMLEILEASHRVTLAALDRADRELAETRRYFEAKAQGDRGERH